jgi:transcriptional regulator GlxA family with amidase domain
LLADASTLGEASRVRRLEGTLIARLRHQGRMGSVNVPALAAWVQDHATRVSVDRLARMAGVSTRHLARLFDDEVGVSPKGSAASRDSGKA